MQDRNDPIPAIGIGSLLRCNDIVRRGQSFDRFRERNRSSRGEPGEIQYAACPPARELALAVTDPGAVPPLLPTELPPTTTRFLDAHASFLTCVGIFPKKCESASLGERISPFKPESGEMGGAG